MTRCLLFLVGFAAYGADPQVRLLVHPTVKLSTHWGLTGWLVGNMPSKGSAVAMVGTRYQNERIWSEFMLAGIRAGYSTRPFFDTRTNLKLTKALNVWGETSVFSNQFYWFTETDYALKHWLTGIETENVHKSGRDSLGLGVHVKFRLAKGVWAGPAYQWRSDKNVVRLYLVIHLQ